MSESIVVIIPALNVDTTLGRQLAALDAQTDLDFRVVVSDNGSTDGTRELCREWMPRFRSLTVVDSSNHPGVAGARNVGYASTSDELILICDGDDRVHPTWVSGMRAALAHSDGATGPLHVIYATTPARNHVWCRDRLPISMNFREFLPGGNMGFRRRALESVGLFDESLVLGQEDVDLGWRLVQAGRTLTHSPDIAIDYYQRDSLRLFLKQQFQYGRAHVHLYFKHRAIAPAPARHRTSLRWFWHWLRQFPWQASTGRLRLAVGSAAFQVGRIVESLRLRVRTPL